MFVVPLQSLERELMMKFKQDKVLGGNASKILTLIWPAGLYDKLLSKEHHC